MLTKDQILRRAQTVLPGGYTAASTEQNGRGDMCVLINKGDKPWVEFDAPQLTVNESTGKVAWIDAITHQPVQSPFRPVA
jgi:hypothetical protein